VLRESNITSSTLLVREPFIFQHEPVHHPTLYCISGHIHPAVSLQGKARQRLRLACFYITPNYLLLPAFGQFTGSATVKPKSGDRIFAIAQNDIIEIKHHEKISV
jgi:metallophosphoesterase superfamily enzyme